MRKKSLNIDDVTEMLLTSLLNDKAPRCDRVLERLWKELWGSRACGQKVTLEDRLLLTETRKRILQNFFDAALRILENLHVTAHEAARLRSRLSLWHRRVGPGGKCLAVAVDAALALVVLRSGRQYGSLALAYSAFGEINGVATKYAEELASLFGGVFRKLSIFACTGLKAVFDTPPTVVGVDVQIRNISLEELVAAPGRKPPGLLGACHDAVQAGADLIVTLDGDARLPLFEIIPAIVHMVQSAETDVALGSRRVDGAVVWKPAYRHLTSLANAICVETVMGPAVGCRIRDPQAIFKVFRHGQLQSALGKMGFQPQQLTLTDLQDGSLAVEVVLLSNLAADGRPLRVTEVPVVETMAYPADPQQMPIMTGGNVKGMFRAANRPRDDVREKALLGEGSETIVIRDARGAVQKVPRFPDRLQAYTLLPSSHIANNRLLDTASGMRGMGRTIVSSIASRCHPDRGFGIRPVILDLLKDQRSVVWSCLPTGMTWEFRYHAIRLPLTSAVVLMLPWMVDRLLLECGMLMARVSMLPAIVIRWLARCARGLRSMCRLVRAGMRPLGRFLANAASLWLRSWDRLVDFLYNALRKSVPVMERLRLFGVFSAVDHLDQRSEVFHSFLCLVTRIVLEFRWLLESCHVSVQLGRPVGCQVQPEPARPLWAILEELPNSMTGELEVLLTMGHDVYRKLGEHGYFDLELSLDNLGIELGPRGARVVLMDFGSLLNSESVPADMAVDRLRLAREHFERSYQVYRLRKAKAHSAAASEIVERHIQATTGLISGWMRLIETHK